MTDPEAWGTETKRTSNAPCPPPVTKLLSGGPGPSPGPRTLSRLGEEGGREGSCTLFPRGCSQGGAERSGRQTDRPATSHAVPGQPAAAAPLTVTALRRPITAPSHRQAAPRSPYIGTGRPGRREARPGPAPAQSSPPPPARPVTRCLTPRRTPALTAAASPPRPHEPGTSTGWGGPQLRRAPRRERAWLPQLEPLPGLGPERPPPRRPGPVNAARQACLGGEGRLGPGSAPRRGRPGWAGRGEAPPLTAAAATQAARAPSRWVTAAHSPLTAGSTSAGQGGRRAAAAGQAALARRGGGAARRANAHRPPPATPFHPLAPPAAACSPPPIGRRRRCPAPFAWPQGKRGRAEVRLLPLVWAGGPRRWQLTAAARRRLSAPCAIVLSRRFYYSVLPALIWTVSSRFTLFPVLPPDRPNLLL